MPLGLTVAAAMRFGWRGWTAGALIVAALAFLIRGRMALAIDDRPITRLRRFLERLYYAHWAGGIGSVILLVGTGIACAFGVLDLGLAATSAYTGGLALGLWAVFVRPRWVTVRTLEIPVRALPDALDGYRIAQLSDLHVGSLLPDDVARSWVRKTNALDVDLVALTGDYVTTGTRYHVAAGKLLGELRARDGVFAVLGNHDNFGDREPLVSTLAATGVHLLQNERMAITRDGATLFEVAGVDDVYTRRADVEKTFAGRNPTTPVLALAHDPKTFPSIAKKGAFLVLSGHTHWGQVGVPLLERRQNIARPFFRYHAHLYREGDSLLYVHPGLGTTGPPVRFGVAPEISVFVLKKV
ncbi:MAG TPA: metallophosphoesterase [Polyangiaceae bacterium]|nr:metallophosphoesterase [Polyangiaceae bacterium]